MTAARKPSADPASPLGLGQLDHHGVPSPAQRWRARTDRSTTPWTTPTCPPGRSHAHRHRRTEKDAAARNAHSARSGIRLTIIPRVHRDHPRQALTTCDRISLAADSHLLGMGGRTVHWYLIPVTQVGVKIPVNRRLRHLGDPRDHPVLRARRARLVVTQLIESSLGELRGIFGIFIGLRATKYGLDVKETTFPISCPGAGINLPMCSYLREFLLTPLGRLICQKIARQRKTHGV